MSLFDIDFKNVYKKVDYMLISRYVCNKNKNRSTPTLVSNWIIM